MLDTSADLSSTRFTQFLLLVTSLVKWIQDTREARRSRRSDLEMRPYKEVGQ